MSQILVELPFIINSALVILGVYYKYITLTQLFIWVGFCQFMINASNAYFENCVKKKERKILSDQSSDILNRFKNTIHQGANQEAIVNNYVTSEVTLRDGSKNILSLTPGIYRLFGSNGSGKSTLLNIILGYERRYSILEQNGLEELINAVQTSNIRLIERDSVIFECLSGFDAQITGPSNTCHAHWKKTMIDSISQLLDDTLAKQWIMIFLALEMEYTNRKDKNMSSGEKIIISFIRFFVSWDSSVRLLVIDECDSFLDHDKKTLFKEAVIKLSHHMAIFISSHDSSIFKVNTNQESIIFDAVTEIS
jgi:ABC-type bacteriocin/lantibiotic exporter with double-glycine peptidase domain